MPEVKSYCVVNDDEKHFCKFDTSVIFLITLKPTKRITRTCIIQWFKYYTESASMRTHYKKYYHYYYAVHAKITAFLVIVVLMRGIPIILLLLKL